MKARELKCKIVGVGAWGSYFSNWEDLQALLNGAEIPEQANKSPKPSVIPANERRRAPLPVKLAVESSFQACESANIPPESLSCVFVSALGDTDLTDYMCKTLASEHKELSPTKFHNSVHNAPAGYWTISTRTMSAANSVAGYEESVSLTLLEAIIQCESEQKPILITFYDAPVSPTLKPLLLNEEAFAFSLIMYPSSSSKDGIQIKANVIYKSTDCWPRLYDISSVKTEYLASMYNTNPCAKILSLATLLSNQKEKVPSLNMPLSKGTTISFERV